MHPYGRQPTRIVTAFPRQPKVRNTLARQPELGESCQNQPHPWIGLLGLTNPRGSPPHILLEEAEGVLDLPTTMHP